ncbi:MAG: winged helix-turn-helix domain-containing protein [Defluviitaleaceae bacterium]|nr:winged helix-turn-helix domain-containing protein [Defluviitaleaceae bacterium]
MNSYEDYTKLFDALSHPMRVKIVGILAGGRKYVSELAKELEMSRPLLYMHLKKLEGASLVVDSYEISETGKTMRFFELKPFDIHLSPSTLQDLAATIPIDAQKSK